MQPTLGSALAWLKLCYGIFSFVLESYLNSDTASGSLLESDSNCSNCFCCSSCRVSCAACDTEEEEILDRVCRIMAISGDTEDVRYLEL